MNASHCGIKRTLLFLTCNPLGNKKSNFLFSEKIEKLNSDLLNSKDDFNLIKQNYPGYKLIYVYKISDNKDNLITPSTFLSDMKFINKLDQYFFYEVYNN